MKKIVLALLLVLLPLSISDAYQHEPGGFGRLYWGMPITQVKQSYRTNFFKYGNDGIDIYMVTIPDAHGELGLLGQYSTLCYFQNDRLVMITIPIFRSRNSVDKDYREQLEFLTKLCGAPRTTSKGRKYWSGSVTDMGIDKAPEFIEIILMDKRYVDRLTRETNSRSA